MPPSHTGSLTATLSAVASIVCALLVLLTLVSGCAGGPRPASITITDCLDLSQADSPDIRRNLHRLRGQPICYRRQQVREGAFHWTFHLLEHRSQPQGPFWVLPHDNEDTAFDVAVQTVLDYGGGLLAVDSNGQRHFRGQDPNRNFSTSRAESRRCRSQRAPAPGYTNAILGHYKGRRGPILTLHNNLDGWQGNGGRGTISLYRDSAWTGAYPGRGQGALRDEDNLVYIAGRRSAAADPKARRQIATLNAAGLNVIHKEVNAYNFDCSLSDHVAWHQLGEYYNVEAEHGAARTQQEMVQRLLSALGVQRLDARRQTSPFLQH